jgi:hypothetical protein
MKMGPNTKKVKNYCKFFKIYLRKEPYVLMFKNSLVGIFVSEFKKFSSRGKSLLCANDLVEDIGKENMMTALNIDNKPMKCLQRCEIQFESVTFSYSAFPIKQTFSQHEYYCLTLEKLSRVCANPFRSKYLEDSMVDVKISCKNISNARDLERACSDKNVPNSIFVQLNPGLSDYLFEYAKTNFAVLRLQIRDPFYTRIKRHEEMPRLTYMGNIGGLLGLSMGFSVVSIFEILYHFLDCFLGLIIKSVYKYKK